MVGTGLEEKADKSKEAAWLMSVPGVGYYIGCPKH